MTFSQKVLTALGASAVAAIAVLAFAEPDIADPDLWGSMAMGRETLLRGWPPAQDPFAYVPTLKPFVYHEWLSGVVFYLLLEYFGSAALKVLMIALGLLTVGCAARAGRRLGASYLSLLVVLMIALLSMQPGYSPIRAQAFTWLFFALFILLLEEGEHGRGRLLLLIPPLTVVWANLHGGFVAGIGLVVLYIVSRLLRGDRPWRLLGICLASVLGTLINPYGLRYWRYLHEALLLPRPRITEWASLRFDLGTDWAFKALLLLAALALVIAPRRYWTGVIVMGVTAFLGIRHVRHIPFFSIAALAYLPVYLGPLLDRVVASFRARVARRPLTATVLVGLLLSWLTVAAVLHLTKITGWKLRVPTSFYPVGAVVFLRLNGLEGNLALPYGWGEYVLWELYPAVKVSFDGRYETVYPPDVADDNFNFMYGTGDWRRLLQRYPTEMVLVAKDYVMAHLMEREPGWTKVYEDRISALYLPTDKSARFWRLPARADGKIP